MLANSPMDSTTAGLTISERERQWHTEQDLILSQLASGEGMDDALSQLADGVAHVLPEMRCSIMLVTPGGTTLNPIYSSEKFPQFYLDAIKELPIAAGVGSCGTAASTGERFIVEDIASHPNWADYRELAHKAGLAACWSQPIFSTSRVVIGTFGLYYDHPKAPDNFELAVIETAAHLAGIILTGHRYRNEIRQADVRYRNLVQAAPVGIAEISLGGTLLSINKSALCMFQFASIESALSTHFIQFISSRGNPEAARLFDEVCSGKTHNTEITGINDTIISCRFIPIHDASRAITHTFGVFEDITERRAYEKRSQDLQVELEQRVRQRTDELEAANANLRQQEADLASLLDAIPDSICIMDEQRRIRSVNRYAATTFGYSKQDLQTKMAGEIVPPRLQTAHRLQTEDIFNQLDSAEPGVLVSFEAVYQRKDGSEVPVEVNASRVAISRGSFYITVNRDISVHKRKHFDLKQETADVKRSARSSFRFLATASHDLRQPMQAISLYLGALDQQMLNPQLVKISGGMHKAMDAMSGIVDAVLDLASLDSANITVNPQPSSIDKLLQQVETAGRPLAAEKSLRLQVDSSALEVHTDIVLLQRILDNFVANALRYTDAGEVRVQVVPCGDSVQLSVRDTGKGIPEDRLEQIFEEYTQLDNPVRERGKGLGLGLAIARHISRLLHHPISVSSQLGVGSTFTVTVPLANSAQAEKSVTSEQASVRIPAAALQNPIHILFIEDDSYIIEATLTLFDSKHFVVYTAANGTEAMEHLKAGVLPDIILSDYRLPEDNGVEVVKKLRQFFQRDIPCILLTGDTSAEKIQRENLPQSTLLYKPVNPDELLQMIRQSLVQ